MGIFYPWKHCGVFYGEYYKQNNALKTGSGAGTYQVSTVYSHFYCGGKIINVCMIVAPPSSLLFTISLGLQVYKAGRVTDILNRKHIKQPTSISAVSGPQPPSCFTRKILKIWVFL